MGWVHPHTDGFAEKWDDEKITDGRFNEQDVFIRYMSNINASMESDFTYEEMNTGATNPSTFLRER